MRCPRCKFEGGILVDGMCPACWREWYLSDHEVVDTDERFGPEPPPEPDDLTGATAGAER